jgi:hypothetical protein
MSNGTQNLALFCTTIGWLRKFSQVPNLSRRLVLAIENDLRAEFVCINLRIDFSGFVSPAL